MIESSMVSINPAAGGTPTRKDATAPAAQSVLSTAAMWLTGTRSPTNGGGDSVSSLDASEVLDSATKWLASEGVTNPVFPNETPKPKRPSSPMRMRYTYDAPPAPISSPRWSPKERTMSARSNSGGGISRSERCHPLRAPPNPETALARTRVPPSPERRRQGRETTEQYPSITVTYNGVNDSPRSSKRKRGRDSSPNIMEGVEGLGQRLKRVCLKAKFHRRARHHVSSEDLTKIGTTQIMLPPKPEAAPITPPDVKREPIQHSSPVPLPKRASSRSLGTGIAAAQDQVAFVASDLPASNATSLVTGVVDSQSETVNTQTAHVLDSKAKIEATAISQAQAFGLQPQQTKNVFLQQRDSGRDAMLEESDLSDQEILFTESATSDEEFAA